MEKGVAIILCLIVIYINRDQNGLSFSDAARRVIFIIFVVVVGGSVVVTNIKVGFPLHRHPIGEVAEIVDIAVKIVTFYHGDISFSPSLYPTMAAVGRYAPLIICMLLGKC